MDITIVPTKKILFGLRPLLKRDTQELKDCLEYIEEEVEQRGGLVTMGHIATKRYQEDTRRIHWELANRN